MRLLVLSWLFSHRDLAECQVDPLANIQFGLGDFMLPKLLHGSSHDDKCSVAYEECLGFPRDVVPDAKLSGCP